MKYPSARILTNNYGDLYYVHLYANNKLHNIYLTSTGEELNWQTSELSIPQREKLVYFETKELAEQTLNKYNNMRNYAALKQEGIDKDLCPEGYIYLGKGDKDNYLSEDWERKDIVRLLSKTDIDETGWDGSISYSDFCVKEEIWNKKFPQEKKEITLNEIKSQLAEAKKLIGKKIKRLSGYNAGIIHKVDKVNLHLENPPVGPNHDDFFAKNGYVISLHESGSAESREADTVFQNGGFQVIEDQKVILNSSYTAIISSEGIKVGCQTFPLEIIDKLVEARKQLV